MRRDNGFHIFDAIHHVEKSPFTYMDSRVRFTIPPDMQYDIIQRQEKYDWKISPSISHSQL